MYGSDVPFTTSNYNVTTTSYDEYMYVMGEKACPEHQMLDREGKRVRVMRRIEDLMQLPLAMEAKLERAEVVAVVSAPLRWSISTILLR